MKRLLSVITVLICLLSVSLAKADEQFTIRNGITFGMSKNTIKQLEKSKLQTEKDGSLTYYPVQVGNNKNGELVYCFDDGKLTNFIYDFKKNVSSRMTLQREYSDLSMSLISKYGSPLGNTDGVTSKWTSQLMDFMFSFVRMAKSTNHRYDYDYEEWLIDSPDGFVKIDHFYYYTEGKKGSTGMHNLVYQLFNVNTNGL